MPKRSAESAGERPTVLVFARYYLPGFRAGGPIRSLANLVDRLGDEFDFRIVTLDRDIGSTSPYRGIEIDRWLPVGRASVMYVQAKAFGLSRVASVLRDTPAKVVYLNSFFDPRFTQQVLLLRCLGQRYGRAAVIAPRGELSEGALQLQRLKKTLFLRVARVIGFYRGLTWQASSEHEAADIRNNIGIRHASASIIVAPNLSPVDIAGTSRSSRGPSERLRVCFVSRVSRKKNLDYAIRVLAQVRTAVRFSIYGPIEDRQYWSECQDLIAHLPSHVTANYSGELPYEEVEGVLAQHDVLLLPTRGENFGHVIREALGVGTVVLTSDQTPWQDLEQYGAGWALPLRDEAQFARALEELAGRDGARAEQASQSARSYAAGRSGSDITEANRRLFLYAMSQSPRQSL